jgi:hypothetical protein
MVFVTGTLMFQDSGSSVTQVAVVEFHRRVAIGYADCRKYRIQNKPPDDDQKRSKHIVTWLHADLCCKQVKCLLSSELFGDNVKDKTNHCQIVTQKCRVKLTLT